MFFPENTSTSDIYEIMNPAVYLPPEDCEVGKFYRISGARSIGQIAVCQLGLENEVIFERRRYKHGQDRLFAEAHHDSVESFGGNIKPHEVLGESPKFMLESGNHKEKLLWILDQETELNISQINQLLSLPESARESIAFKQELEQASIIGYGLIRAKTKLTKLT